MSLHLIANTLISGSCGWSPTINAHHLAVKITSSITRVKRTVHKFHRKFYHNRSTHHSLIVGRDLGRALAAAGLTTSVGSATGRKTLRACLWGPLVRAPCFPPLLSQQINYELRITLISSRHQRTRNTFPVESFWHLANLFHYGRRATPMIST